MVDRSPREMISPAPTFKKQNTIGESKLQFSPNQTPKRNTEEENFEYNIVDKKDLEEIRWLL